MLQMLNFADCRVTMRSAEIIRVYSPRDPRAGPDCNDADISIRTVISQGGNCFPICNADGCSPDEVLACERTDGCALGETGACNGDGAECAGVLIEESCPGTCTWASHCGEEIVFCAASHNSEAHHFDVAVGAGKSFLVKSGSDTQWTVCPTQPAKGVVKKVSSEGGIIEIIGGYRNSNTATPGSNVQTIGAQGTGHVLNEEGHLIPSRGKSVNACNVFLYVRSAPL